MVQTTKTLNPLPLQDLEPHRFEDLVRQLAYDFRQWQSLEAVGRSGADEGIDIRGTEGGVRDVHVDNGGDESEGEALEAEDTPAALGPASSSRTWVFQCKREKSLGPRDIKRIINDFFGTAADAPHGYVLAAACDFSKKARDTFRDALRARGVQEFYMWGRGEIEDQLVLPKNDHVLFAFFGISLQVRRISVRTRVRSRLALKRRLTKELGGISFESPHVILIRDPNDESYPFVNDKQAFASAPRWGYWEYLRQEPPDHLMFLVKKFYAFADWSTGEWDYMKGKDTAEPDFPELWGAPRRGATHEELEICRAHWNLHVPSANRAWLIAQGAIHLDRILAFDELGDSLNAGPHLLVEYRNGDVFHPSWAKIEPAEMSVDSLIYPTGADDPKRVNRFPAVLPDERETYYAKVKAETEERHRKPSS